MTGILITAIGSVFFSSGATVGGQPFWPLAVTGAKADDEGVGHGNPAVATRRGRATPVRSRSEARCPGVRRAVAYYLRRVGYWRNRMRAAGHQDPVRGGIITHRCPRYLSKVLRAKAYGLRRAYGRYVAYHYHWWKWMPAKLQRVGACETGYGRRPGNFHWDSGTYVSFAGIIRGGYATVAHSIGLRSWDETRRELGRDPTPREQVLVTLALQARYGWGAWGCGGA